MTTRSPPPRFPQVPFVVAKFVIFDATIGLLYGFLSTSLPSEMAALADPLSSLLAGAIAG